MERVLHEADGAYGQRGYEALKWVEAATSAGDTKTHGDGWKFHAGETGRNGHLYLLRISGSTSWVTHRLKGSASGLRLRRMRE